VRVETDQPVPGNGGQPARVLGTGGPVCRSYSARRFGHNTGTVSWHLRHLAQFGFIEDAPELGDGRERWWRHVSPRTSLDIRDAGIRDDPAAIEAARWFVRHSWARLTERIDGWFRTGERWSSAWIGGSVLFDTILHLSPDELQALQGDLLAVVENYRGRSPMTDVPDKRRVQVAIQAFPLDDPDDG
jgi:hypothetical protein